MLITILKRGGAIATFLLLMAAVAFYAGRAQSELSAEFAHAQTVSGTVVALDKRQRMQGGSTRTTYTVTVSVPGGRHREFVSGDLFAQLEEGEAVNVRRLSGSPTRYRLDVPHLQASSMWALGLGALLLLGGATLMRFGIRSGRKEWRLQHFGVKTVGTVVALPDAMIPKVRVAFTDATGMAQLITCVRPPPSTVGTLEAGQTVVLTVDPDAPHDAVITGAAGS